MNLTIVSHVVVGDLDTSVEVQLIAKDLNEDTKVFRYFLHIQSLLILILKA